MSKKIMRETIHAKGLEIGIYTEDFKNEYVSLTDIAKYRSIQPSITVHNWLRGRDIVEFLGLWEALHNPNFNLIEFDKFKTDAGTNAFVFSIKTWTDELHAIGLLSKSGRYGGGIYAHMDIALEFASWLSPEFKLYIIKDYKRLKSDERSRLSLEWNLNREISKLNYRIHTDAIKNYLVLPDLTKEQLSFQYASEADLLNVALFAMTAKEWRAGNKGKKGNIRDHATIQQLLVLSNMESYNAILIQQGFSQAERLVRLRDMAIRQMETISELSLANLPLIEDKRKSN